MENVFFREIETIFNIQLRFYEANGKRNLKDVKKFHIKTIFKENTIKR